MTHCDTSPARLLAASTVHDPVDSTPPPASNEGIGEAKAIGRAKPTTNRGFAKASQTGRSSSVRAAIFLSASLTCAGLGCAAGSPAPSQSPTASPPVWDVGALAEVGPEAEVDHLNALLQAGTAHAAVQRLDRLLDLIDAARFGQHGPAATALWRALGGKPAAQRGGDLQAVAQKLIEAAWKIDARDDLLPEDRAVLADIIATVSIDAQPPSETSGLAAQSLAIHHLLAEATPQVVDNARWRLYDHARAIIDTAMLADGTSQASLLRSGLYLEANLTEQLADETIPFDWLATRELIVQTAASSLRELERDEKWQAIARARRIEDEARWQPHRDALASSRTKISGLWKSSNTRTSPEEMGPLFWTTVADRGLNEDSLEHHWQLPHHGQANHASWTLAFVPETSGSAIVELLELATQSPVTRFALAVAPANDEKLPAFVQKPLSAFTLEKLTPELAAESRVQVAVDGRGIAIGMEGKWSPMRPWSEDVAREVVEELEQAFPDEPLVGIAVTSDAQHQQLMAVLAQFHAERLEANHRVLTLEPLKTLPGASPAVGRRLAARKNWRRSLSNAPFHRGKELRADNQALLEVTMRELPLCLVELEDLKQSKPIELVIALEDGEVVHTTWSNAPAAAKAQKRQLERCVTARMSPMLLLDLDAMSELKVAIPVR